ncbi:hypothetical protein Z043_101360 [Scleropages formosus]|uniref:Uncharacterized protein n=1 Tax=Scleropages formosus TaxID=113540 RepID=A0A0P7VRQ0_SCLFO|nr:hypothetical protein Z043_101360 [Scleropages formosus]
MRVVLRWSLGEPRPPEALSNERWRFAAAFPSGTWAGVAHTPGDLTRYEELPPCGLAAPVHEEVLPLLETGVEKRGAASGADAGKESRSHRGEEYRTTELLGSAKRVNVNFQDTDGFAALHHAALNGNMELISLLLESQATVDIKDQKGNNPPPTLTHSGRATDLSL